jgi:hypothetical protein
LFTSVKSIGSYSLDHFYCTVQSESALRCFNIDGLGKEDDLFRIERLPLEQGLGHGFHLVPVGFDEFARQGVLLVDDAPDLGVHALHGGLGDILVRGD